MNKLIVFQGLPASGKTTKAKEMINISGDEYKRVNKDDLREMIDNSKWSKERENNILKIRDMIINYYLQNGYSVISDDTNLNPFHIEKFKEIALQNKVELVIDDSFCKVNYKKCIERDLVRKDKDPVGKDVIIRMYRKYLESKIESPKYNIDLQDCVVVDIDGTTALHEYRTPFEYHKCLSDELNEPIANLVKLLHEKYKVVYVTGRENIFYDEIIRTDVKRLTIEWLMKHNLWFEDSEIYIREEKDHRPDHIVKKEIYENNLENKYNIVYIIDDREQVIDMWRSLGLTVLDVAGHIW